jgi:hypothetical protein
LCACELRANFGRFVTADYFKKTIFYFPGFVFLFPTSPQESPGWKKISPSKCTVTVCLQNQNPNSAVFRLSECSTQYSHRRQIQSSQLRREPAGNARKPYLPSRCLDMTTRSNIHHEIISWAGAVGANVRGRARAASFY